MWNRSDRKANSVGQTGFNHLAFATPLASLVGWYLASQGLPNEVVVPATALTVSAVTIVGTVIRNIAEAKGWSKFIG